MASDLDLKAFTELTGYFWATQDGEPLIVEGSSSGWYRTGSEESIIIDSLGPKISPPVKDKETIKWLITPPSSIEEMYQRPALSYEMAPKDSDVEDIASKIVDDVWENHFCSLDTIKELLHRGGYPEMHGISKPHSDKIAELIMQTVIERLKQSVDESRNREDYND